VDRDEVMNASLATAGVIAGDPGVQSSQYSSAADEVTAQSVNRQILLPLLRHSDGERFAGHSRN